MFGTKYRPIDFESVIGLDNIKEILKAYVRNKSYNQAYLFEGEYSSGKTTLARIFARAILCDNVTDTFSPCNDCFSCREFLAERNPCYVEIDAANNGTKEGIQDILERLSYETVASKRVIFLDECQDISKAGNNSLLIKLEKMMEESIFLFGTTDIDKVPEALRSRCVEFNLPLPSDDMVYDKLVRICKEADIKYEKDALYEIVKSADRHYRNAEISLGVTSYLGDVTLDNVNKVVKNYTKEIAYMLGTLPYDIEKALKAAEYLSARISARNIYDAVLRMLVDTAKYNLGFTFGSDTYTDIMKALSVQYKQSIYEVLDYVISKQRLTDATVLQSDILVMHYKFMQEHFEPRGSVPKKIVQKDDSSGEKVSSEKQNLAYINSRPPWEREDIVRKLKAKRIGSEEKKETVQERVSRTWDKEVSNKQMSTKKAVLKGNISQEDFGEALKESLNEGEI